MSELSVWGLITITLIVTGCASPGYTVREAYDRLDENAATIHHSDRYGDIQYKLREGAGIPVLVIHGLVGGYDQAMQTGTTLLPGDRQFLAISRFGYLESALPDEPDPANQCRAFTEVLDAQRIDRTFLLATSAGGTVALKFALFYPERVAGLILIGSAYPSDGEEIPKGPPNFVYRDWVFQFMVNHMQGTLLQMFGISREEYTAATPAERQNLDRLFRRLLPINPRRAGILNDVNLTNPDGIRNYTEYPLERLQCPVLVLHARNDPMAKYPIMEQAVQRLPDVKTVVYQRGGHLLFGHQEANQHHIEEFLKSHGANETQP